MSAAVQISQASRVTIATVRGSVRVGTGRAAFFLSAPAVVTLAAAAPRVTLFAAPRLVVVGGKQGIAGPPGPEGTGVLDLEPRLAALEDTAVRTGLLDW